MVVERRCKRLARCKPSLPLTLALGPPQVHYHVGGIQGADLRSPCLTETSQMQMHKQREAEAKAKAAEQAVKDEVRPKLDLFGGAGFCGRLLTIAAGAPQTGRGGQEARKPD